MTGDCINECALIGYSIERIPSMLAHDQTKRISDLQRGELLFQNVRDFVTEFEVQASIDHPPILLY